MRNHLYKLALMVALGSGFALAQTMPQNPPAVPQTQQPSTADQGKANTANVQGDIQSALQKDPSLSSATISVKVSEKGVELSGTVPSKDAKDAAEQIAKSHSGGLDVKNNIKVESPDMPKR